MKEFGNYHPIVNFLYFAAVIGMTMFLMHPICLGVTLISAFLCSVLSKGRRAALFGVIGVLPMMIVAALLNPVFNHQGVTILSYLPNGNPLTFESIAFGIAAASMIAAVICWFSCYNEIMTSEKFLYLFGRIIPSLALVFSMTLGFVPKFRERFRIVVRTQRGIGKDISQGSVRTRIGRCVNVLSVMVTWMLESSIETSASMKCRGYGLKGRTAFSMYSFSRRDFCALGFLVGAIIYVIAGFCLDAIYFNFFPMIIWGEVSFFSVSVFVMHFAICMLPVYIEVKERLKWNIMKSRI